MRLKLTLEYDGTGFHGWARQPGLRTVEDVVWVALDSTFRSWTELAVAGRTDAGVHASAQVASVDADGGPPPERAAEALNAALPDDVAVVGVDSARPDFHARFSAVSRTYRYRVLARRTRSPLDGRRALWWPRTIDVDALGAAADRRAGEHDFQAVTPTETEHHALRL